MMLLLLTIAAAVIDAIDCVSHQVAASFFFVTILLSIMLRSLGRVSSVSRSSSLFSSPAVSPLFSQLSRSYHARVIDHYENPRNVGSLNPNDPNVGTGLVGAPACGDVMKLQLKVNDEGIITEAKFKTFGCGSAIASSSLATTLAKGKSVDEVLKIKNQEIAKHLSLPPVKLHCSMLAEDAIKAAVKDYHKKKAAQAAALSSSTTTASSTSSSSAEPIKVTAAQ